MHTSAYIFASFPGRNVKGRGKGRGKGTARATGGNPGESGDADQAGVQSGTPQPGQQAGVQLGSSAARVSGSGSGSSSSASAGSSEPAGPAVVPVVLSHAPPRSYGNHYMYVTVLGGRGDIVISPTMRKMNAHCLGFAHNFDKTKCHLDRSIPPEGTEQRGRLFKGRPIGLLMYWLQYGPCTRVEHGLCKKDVAGPGYRGRREDARKLLWEMRQEHPLVANIFSIELPPPSDVAASVPELWEPEEVF